MTNGEILNRIDGYVDQHLSGIRGYIRQEPYIGDFFKLFAAAYANRKATDSAASHITGDGLVEELGERYYQTDSSEKHKRKLDLLRKLGAMWSEWDYAWEMYPRLRHFSDA